VWYLKNSLIVKNENSGSTRLNSFVLSSTPGRVPRSQTAEISKMDMKIEKNIDRTRIIINGRRKLNIFKKLFILCTYLKFFILILLFKQLKYT